MTPPTYRPTRTARELGDPGSTRRDAVKAGGGLAFAALALAGLGGRAVAQGSTPEASPAASPVSAAALEGYYIVVRSRTVKPDRSVDELVALIREGFVPLVSAVPGFVRYTVGVNPDTRAQFSVGVFADKAGADESTRLAAEWGAQGAADYVEGDPIVVEGLIAIAEATS